VYKRQVRMSASEKRIGEARGVTMGKLMAEIGTMFEGDANLKAVKVCTV